MPMFGGHNECRHSAQLCRVSACSRAGGRGRSDRWPPAPLRHNGQAPSQGRRVQGVSGRSGLHLVEELAHRRRGNMDGQAGKGIQRRPAQGSARAPCRRQSRHKGRAGSSLEGSRKAGREHLEPFPNRRGRSSLSATKGSPGHRLATDGGRTAYCPDSGSIRPDTEPAIHPVGQAHRGDGQILSQGRQNVRRPLLHSCAKRHQGRPVAYCRRLRHRGKPVSGYRVRRADRLQCR